MTFESPTRNFIRERRRKLKEEKLPESLPTEIRISSNPTNTRRPSLEVPLLPFVSIKTSSSHKFILPREAACLSGVIQLMLEGACSGFREGETGNLIINDIEDEILERVIRYCVQDWLLNSPEKTAKRTQILSPMKPNPPKPVINPFENPIIPNSIWGRENEPLYHHLYRVEFCVEMPSEYAMELLMASHFLDIPGLVTISCKMLAENIDRVVTLQGLPDDVVQQIYFHLPPTKLAELESTRLDLAPSEYNPETPQLNQLNGFFSNSEVWKQFYYRQEWHLDRVSFYESHYNNHWSMQLRAFKTPEPYNPIPPWEPDVLDSIMPGRPHHDENDLPRWTWKCEYLQRHIQNLLDAFSPSMDQEAFSHDLNYCARFIRLLKLPPSFLECLSPPKKDENQKDNLISIIDSTLGSSMWQGSLSFSLNEFLKRFPELQFLDMSGFRFDERTIQIIVRSILKSNPHLKALRLSAVHLTDRGVRLICQLLSKHPLVSLDLSENQLTGKALTYLAKSLSYHKSLKCLSVSENHITKSGERPELKWPSITAHWELRNAREIRQLNQIASSARYKVTISDSDTSDEETEFLNSFKMRNGFDNLLTSLKNNSTLELLDLSLNSVHFSCLSHHAWEGLKANESLRVFLIDGTHLVSDLSQSVRFNPFEFFPSSLEYMNLSACNLQPVHVFHLTESLSRLSKLRVLDLSDNLIGNAAEQAFVGLIRNGTLSGLDLSKNSLWDTISVSLASALSQNYTISTLRLSRNYLRCGVRDIVRAALERTHSDPSLEPLELALDSNQVLSGSYFYIRELIQPVHSQISLCI